MNARTIAQQTNIEASRRNIPLSVFAEVTRACNLKCYYCYQGGHAAGEELSVSRWRSLCGELADAGSLYIAFSGGEPFMRVDFLDIVSAARDNNFAVSIITNGTLMNGDMIARTARLGVMDVGVSLLGAHKDLHDRLSGVEGSFEKALGAVRGLVRAGVKVVVKHCVSSENFGDYHALERLALDEGAAFECDSTVLPAESGRVSPFALNVDQHRTFLRDMGYKPLSSCVSSETTWALHCDAGRSMCGLSPEGDVTPCVLLPVLFGSVARSSFGEVWNSAAAQRFREEELRLEDVCESCTMHAMCSRCHAVAYMETGSWRGSSRSLCDRAKAMQEQAMR